MNKLGFAIRAVALLAASLLLSACSGPLNEYGQANQTAVTEMIQAANAAGLVDTKAQPQRGCAIPFDCSPTQEFGTTLNVSGEGLNAQQGCKAFIAFGRKIAAGHFGTQSGDSTADGDLSSLKTDVMMSACTKQLAQGLENPDFSAIDRQESMPVYLGGSFKTSTGKLVPYSMQFDAYKTKAGKTGFYVYISANSDPAAGM